MTKDEFFVWYAEREKVTAEWLWERGYQAIKCHCGLAKCKGWQMWRDECHTDEGVKKSR